MIKPVFTQLASRTLSILFGLILMANSLHSQVTYHCNFDDTMQNGTVAFSVTAFGNSPNEVWTVENVKNLYQSIDPDIPYQNGFQMSPHPTKPNAYYFKGFAYDGIMPSATIMNASVPDVDMQMLTCMSPQPMIDGEVDFCLGSTTTLTLSLTNQTIKAGSVVWSALGPVASTNQSGVNGEIFEVGYLTTGSYIVTVSGQTNSGFDFNDNVILNVFDIAEDYVIDGPMYLCFANNEDVVYNVNIPDELAVDWSSTPGVISINPLTGSGSSAEVTFPDVPGLYTLSIENRDPDGCLINSVFKPVQIVDVIDTVSINGDVHVCVGDTENYSVDPNLTGVSWNVFPGDPPTGSGSYFMDPPSGSGSSINVTYFESGTFDLVVSGTNVDGCPFESSLTVTVPGDEVGSLACNNTVNVSLNNDCTLEIYADMILEGDYNMDEAYQLTIIDVVTGEDVTGSIITQDQLGHTFMVTVTQECGGNSCWGTIVVEDKSIPDLICPGSESLTCFDFNDDPANPAGWPLFDEDATWIYRADKNDWIVSGFDNCSDVILSYVDSYQSADECADPQHIVRSWTAVDINNGLSTSCDVDIYVGLVTTSSIIWPPNWDSALDNDAPGDPDTDNTFGSLDACDLNNPVELLCTSWLNNQDSNGNPLPTCTGAPEGLLCSNLQLIGYKDQVIPICGNAKKILRRWSVWDACANEDVHYTQVITIMDTSDPICIAPADKAYYTDTHECGSDIVLDPPTVTNECAGWSYQVKYKTGNYNDGLPETFIKSNLSYDASTNSYTIHDLEFDYDSLWVQYIITDICGNRIDDCYGEFELIDDEQPIPACDLNTSIALNSGAHAYAGPSTFDDHSWDNCGVYTKVIQRMDNRCHCYERELDFMHKLGEYNGHYYYLSKDRMNGRRAFAIAEALDGYIAVIDSAAENSWLRDAVSNITTAQYYIGLKGNDFNVNNMYWDNDDNDYNFNGHWDVNEPFPDANYEKGNVFVVVNEDGSWEAERQTGHYDFFVIEFDSKCGWTQKETFCCEDLGEETMVSMKVIDFEGNNNFCMVNVNVQDFIPPRMICPENDTISCSYPYDLDDLSEFGFATAQDDCEVEVYEENAVVLPFNCQQGQIQRSFAATDGLNVSRCTQIIYIQNDVPFVADSIYWPADTLVTDICTLEGWDPGDHVPKWNEDAFPCSTIIYTYEDLLFKIVEGACQKVIRTWTVVDWCDPDTQWTYDQVIKLMNTNGPQFSGSTCQGLSVPDGELVGTCLVQVDDVIGEVQAHAMACNENLKWSYTIDYDSDGSIEVNGSGNDASGPYPYGSHVLTWIVQDECDNVSTCNKTIVVQDNKAPNPYCYGEIVIPISTPEGVDVWTSDIDLGSQDDCPDNDVYLSFDENQMINSINVSCDDIPDSLNYGYVYVDLWVWDHPNPNIANKSYCTVKIQVQDNAGVCGTSPMSMIAGNVITEQYEVIENVEMSLMSNSPEYPLSYMAELGEYAFADVPMYADYSVKAFKDDNYLNGVSTLDLVMIQRHILGIQRLDSPYKLIAADINSSADISAIDLIELRKLILGIYDELPNNHSWRFVPESYVFSDPENPWPFDEQIDINDIDQAIMDANFMGVKIGDVNGSVVANLISDEIASRSSENFDINVIQTVTDKGNTRIQLKAAQSAYTAGAQLGLSFNESVTDLIAAIPMALNIENHNIAWQKLDNGQLTISWNALESVIVNEGDVLMEFLFEGSHNRSILSANDNPMSSEAYLVDTDNKVLVQNLRLIDNEIADNIEFEVFQNVPNPFNESTSIGFNITERSNVVLTVSDANGRVVLSEEREYPSGYNEILLSSDKLETTGILYYKLSTATHTITKKMIVLR